MLEAAQAGTGHPARQLDQSTHPAPSFPAQLFPAAHLGSALPSLEFLSLPPGAEEAQPFQTDFLVLQ